jgi:hypothetical protein
MKLINILKELVTNMEIICDNCGWKWKIKDGGNDLYICHKCNHDNTPEELKEEKKKRDRCLRIADRKYDKPSAYKSGAVVKCRQGTIWKGLKEEVIQEKVKETLRTWFSRKGEPGKKSGWVDCNAPIRKDGKVTGYKSCGREEGEKRSKYPSCRPTAAQCKTPGKGTKWGKTK